MKKKSILIFGAGLNQYMLIKAAKDLAVTSIVLDPDPDPPGKKICDHFYCVAGNDYQTTKEIAIKHKIFGLATTQMEKPLRLMARLAKDIGLPFHSPEVIEKSLDKWLMKQVFLQHAIPCASGKLFTKYQKIKAKDLIDLQFPLVLKPKDATSSQGVFRVETFEEIEKYEPVTRSFSKNGELIIEEFLEGPEYSIETITHEGKTTIIQYTEKFVTPFPYTVEMGHLQPADLTEVQKDKIAKIVISAIHAIGMDNSAAHTELKLTSDGPKIIEIGPRGGGDFISSYLTLAATGINMDEAIIKTALKEEPDLSPKRNMYAYIKYFSLPVGSKILNVDNYSDILNNKNVVFAHIAVKAGDVIEGITESKKRPGFVIAYGKSKKDVLNITDNIINKLKYKIKL